MINIVIYKSFYVFCFSCLAALYSKQAFGVNGTETYYTGSIIISEKKKKAGNLKILTVVSNTTKKLLKKKKISSRLLLDIPEDRSSRGSS